MILSALRFWLRSLIAVFLCKQSVSKEVLDYAGGIMKMRSTTVLAISLITVAVMAAACSSSSPTITFKANYEAIRNKDVAAYKRTLSKSALAAYEDEGKGRNQSLENRSLDAVLKSYLDADQAYLISGMSKSGTQSGKITVSGSKVYLLMRVNAERPAALPETRNEKIAGDIATLEVKSQKGDWDKAVFYKEDGEWKLGGRAVGLDL